MAAVSIDIIFLALRDCTGSVQIILVGSLQIMSDLSDERSLALPPAPSPAPMAPAAPAPPLPEQRMDEVWQGEDVEEGVGAEEDQATTLARAEQVQQLTEEQVEQLVRPTR